MTYRIGLALALLALVTPRLYAQRARVTVSEGDVARRTERVDTTRLAPRIPAVSPPLADKLRIGGDSAQRIAMHDFQWRGRVSSIEIDEEDSRVFWDVKVVPDSTAATIVRYRVDAMTGGILDIKEFTGIRGLARRP